MNPSTQKKPTAATAAAAAKVKCSRKAGGCGTEVAELYAENVCLKCFKTHLKEKIGSMDDVGSEIEQEYALVFPSKKKATPADPKKLAALVGAPIVAMESDINSGDGDDDEDDEDDEDEEDDSLVVSDNVVSYASSSSESESESEGYDDKVNSDKKRGRSEGGGGNKLGEIAHRILLAKARTPIDSRLKELYDLHAKASTAASEEQNKYLAAADVALEKLETLKSIFVINTVLGKRHLTYPDAFCTFEEAEAKCALLKIQTPGLEGEVEEKTL